MSAYDVAVRPVAIRVRTSRAEPVDPAAVHLVGGRGDVVGRGVPRQRRGRRPAGRLQSGGCRRRHVSPPGSESSSRSRPGPRSARGRRCGPRPASPAEPLAPHGVAADPQRAGAGRDRSRLGARGDLGAVDVEPHGGAVDRSSARCDPGVEWQGRRGVERSTSAPPTDRVPFGRPADLAAARTARRSARSGRSLSSTWSHERVAVGRAHAVSVQVAGQVEGVAVRDRDPVVDAVEADARRRADRW